VNARRGPHVGRVTLQHDAHQTRPRTPALLSLSRPATTTASPALLSATARQGKRHCRDQRPIPSPARPYDGSPHTAAIHVDHGRNVSTWPRGSFTLKHDAQPTPHVPSDSLSFPRRRQLRRLDMHDDQATASPRPSSTSLSAVHQRRPNVRTQPSHRAIITSLMRRETAEGGHRPAASSEHTHLNPARTPATP